MFANYDANTYKSHSFMIGAATTAHMLGLSDSKIRAMGRWHSRADTTFCSSQYKRPIKNHKFETLTFEEQTRILYALLIVVNNHAKMHTPTMTGYKVMKQT